MPPLRQVVLSFTPGDNNQRAFLWQNGSFRDLGGSPGEFTAAFAINEGGVVAPRHVPSGTQRLPQSRRMYRHHLPGLEASRPE